MSKRSESVSPGASGRRERVVAAVAVVTAPQAHKTFCIQMGWVLRPFIGRPDSPVELFREESWGNAYVVVARPIYETLLQ